MHRSTLNYIVDALTLLLILAMTATGLILRFVLPPGSGGRGGGNARVLWESSRHEWGDIHFWLAAGLGVIILVHIALHWAWVCGITRRLLGLSLVGNAHGATRRNLAGAALIGFVAVLLTGFTWWANGNVTFRESGKSERHGRATLLPIADPGESLSPDHTSQIRGSMTLQQLADQSGLSVVLLRERLGLPSDVSPDARLGHLRREYGFSMSYVRRIVDSAMARLPGGKEQTP